MVDTNIIDKINLIFKFISNNSLIFLASLLSIFIIFDLIYGRNKLSTKILYIIILILNLLYVFLIYYKSLFNIIDIYITYITKIMYFPSIIEYFNMILISIILQIYSIRKDKGIVKLINIICSLLIELLFILNIVCLSNTNINLNNITSIYESDILLSIFQITGILFIIFIIFNIIVYIIRKIFNNRVEMPKLNNDYE